MRSAIALLVIVGLVALTVAAVSLPAGSGAHAQTTTIQVGDVWFCDHSFQNGVCKTTVSVGDIIIWQDIDTSPSDIPHTVTQCGATCDDPSPTVPLFDSRTDPADDGQSPPFNTYLDGGETYSFTFDSPGTYIYRCEIHPSPMRGTITVLAQPTPIPTPTAQPSPGPSPQPTAQPSPQVLSEESTQSAGPAPVDAQPAAVPAGGGEPPSDDGASALWWWALAAGGLLLVATATLALRRLRR